MRVLLFSLLFLLFSVTGYAQVPPKPSVNEHVFDYANVIDDTAEEKMRALIQQIEKETSNQIVLMTIDTIGEMEPFEFGTQVIRQWGIGQAGVNNGMLIYTTTEQGEGNNTVWISVGQGLGGQFPDGKLGRMIDYYMLDSLIDGDFTTAFEDILDVTAQEMLGEIEDADPGEMARWEILLIIFSFILFSGVLVFLIIVNKNKQYFIDRGWTISSGGYFSDSSNSSDSDDGFGGGSSDGGGSGRSF